jgi:Xaa-Pro aminopeptidase
VLYVDESKVSEEVRNGLARSGISIRPYDTIFQDVKALPETTTVYLCEERVSMAVRQCLSCRVVTGKELTDLPKARKNETELKNWKRVQELDGTAMVRFWKWLEEEVPKGGVNEVHAANELERFRRSCPDCVDLSFASISACGANAAMMHYFARRDTCAVLESEGLYLIDSGGQYFGGTTDITRTLALGDLTDQQRTDYTLVLKGLIGLSTARFLKGAAGFNLDVLARRPLWEQGLDYKCGTGHGVGCYLSVHEGPQGFSQSKHCDTPFEPGMVMTIEPGIYREGRYGIRIENMVVVEKACETDSGTFCRFATMTLCPIDTAPLKAGLMTESEIEWLNTYHRTVQERLSPHLSDEEQNWLQTKTRPFPAV